MLIKLYIALLFAILMDNEFISAHNHLWPHDNDDWFKDYVGLLVNYEKEVEED